MFEIFCLMVSGFGLTDRMRTQLFRAAKTMVENGKQKQPIKNDDFEASIRTDFKYTGLGSFYGILFIAEVESDRGETKVTYIVRTKDLEKVNLDECFWLTHDSHLVEKAPYN